MFKIILTNFISFFILCQPVICFSQNKELLFVLNSMDNDISAIDLNTKVVDFKIPTGKEPHHFYLTPDKKSLIVANAGGDSLTFIDPKTGSLQRTLRGIVDPYHLRFSPDMKWLVTLANRLDHVDIYKWENNNPVLVKRIATSKTPSHLWIDSKSTTAFASMQDSNELIAINLKTQSISWRINIGSIPADVFGTPDDKKLFVALTGDKKVLVFDIESSPAKLIKEIVTDSGAHAFRALGDGHHLFVSNRVANNVTKINYKTLEIVETIPVPGGPDCMEISEDQQKLYVSSRWIGKLSVVDLKSRKVIDQIKVGKSPHGVWTLRHSSRH